eukprot:TRINITY_DN8370_c0_g1_i2.p1 TRINITY_DN8370_c0_g1~~TRINITY_DN8370_c0_g1_i2.p1  ORF type:complete len:169 (+),score=33.61 TRINITY_DN8370_c0_g1_i2:345-851(+)
MEGEELAWRHAHEGDMAFLWGGLKEIHALETGDEDAENAKIYCNSALEDAPNRSIIAFYKTEAGDQPAGFLTFKVSGAHPFGVSYGPYGNKFAFVDYVYVSPSYRKRGVGSYLYDRLADVCKTIGVPEIILDVYNHNAPSMSFHQGMGFKPFVQLFSKKVGDANPGAS